MSAAFPKSSGRILTRYSHPTSPPPWADAIELALDDPAGAMERARRLRERIFQHFSQKAMVEGVLAGYRDAFANR
jgi:hypothetical protein